MRTLNRGTLHTILAVGLAMGLASSAFAGEIFLGGGNAAPGMFYSGGQWSVSAGTGWSGATWVSPGTPFPDTVWNYSGSIEWTGNPLINDTSSGGLARGEFGGGGTFRMMGSVNDALGGPVVGYQNVMLLEGTVSGFLVEETDPGTNDFDTEGAPPILTVTGGVLTTGGGANYMQVGALYQMDVNIQSAVNGQGSIDDFINSPFVSASSGHQINFVLVPEPTALALLALGGLVVLRRR